MRTLAIEQSRSRFDGNLSLSLFRSCPWVALAMLAGDVLAVELAVGLGYFTRWLLSEWLPVELLPGTYVGIMGGILVLPLLYLVSGLYPGYRLGEIARMRRRISLAMIVFALLIAWDHLVQRGEWSRGILLSSFVFALVFLWLAESLVRRLLIARNLWGEPVVIVGANSTGVAMARQLLDDPRLGLVPIGFIDDRQNYAQDRREAVSLLGSIRGAADTCQDVRCAVLALPELPATRLTEIYDRLPCADILMLPSQHTVQTLWIMPQDLGGRLALRVRRSLLLKHNRIIKRGFDIVTVCLIGLVAAPLVAICAAAVKLIDPGPAFYRQPRGGEGGREFDMIKLRTMFNEAEGLLSEHLLEDDDARAEWNRHMKLRDDPRVLPGVGRFMRRWSIDELPQLWHVVKGEMSIVGPRPLPDYHLDQFSVEFRRLRRSVRPGMTGLWQVEGRSDSDLTTQEQLDAYYIRNWSLWFDLYVLVRTIPAILLGRGAR